MIKLDNLVFQYAASDEPVFAQFSWQTGPGESWSVIGPSGCGKTTLLYLVAGLRHPTGGQIQVGGQVISRPRPRTGLILQDYGLLPWATVRQNVTLGLRIRQFYGPDGKHSPEDFRPGDLDARVEMWLNRLGIAGQAAKFPGQISGGQRQRVAIARTLVMEPDLLLMDEPFSALDAPTREDLQNVVVSLHRETGIAMLLVTHNIEEAVFIGRKILVLNQPPNVEPQVIDNPEAASPGFRNSVNFLQRCAQVREGMGLAA